MTTYEQINKIARAAGGEADWSHNIGANRSYASFVVKGYTVFVGLDAGQGLFGCLTSVRDEKWDGASVEHPEVKTVANLQKMIRLLPIPWEKK